MLDKIMKYCVYSFFCFFWTIIGLPIYIFTVSRTILFGSFKMFLTIFNGGDAKHVADNIQSVMMFWPNGFITAKNAIFSPEIYAQQNRVYKSFGSFITEFVVLLFFLILIVGIYDKTIILNIWRSFVSLISNFAVEISGFFGAAYEIIKN